MLDDTFELAYVPGPRILLQPRRGFGREPFGTLAILRREHRDEVFGKQWNVLLTLMMVK